VEFATSLNLLERVEELRRQLDGNPVVAGTLGR
jgi:hypothetical protein